MVAAKSQQPQFLSASLPLLINGYLQQTDCAANQGREGQFSSGQRVPGGAQSLSLQQGDDDTAVPCVPNTLPDLPWIVCLVKSTGSL